MIKFTNKEKEKIFDKISALYFNKNFGSTSKADLELLLFSEYIEHYLDSKNQDNDFSDYNISKELGITQNRVRSLKERKELKYPHKDFKWEEDFPKCLENAKYDEVTHKLKFYVEDVNVQNEIRHYLTIKGYFDEYSLNSKLCIIPLGSLADIIDDFELNDELKKKFTKLYESEFNGNNTVKEFLADFTKDGLKQLLMKGSTELAAAALNAIIPGAGIAGKAILSTVAKVIKK